MTSVVIPAFNSEKTIRQCLAALAKQTAPRDSYEIIVVDDGSTDRTAEVAAHLNARVIGQPNGGAAAARNAGARHASGNLVLFIDADSVPDLCWVQAMTAPFADPGVVGVSGEKKTRQRNLIARFVQMEYDYKYERIAAHASIDFVDSSTAAYRKNIFLANGGFDTSLMEAEDVELSFRLAERGYRMVLVREAVAYHTHPESFIEYWRRKFQYARWRGQVYARYPRKAASDSRTPHSQKLQAIFAFAFVFCAVSALAGRALGWLTVLFGLLFGASALPIVAYCWKRSRAVALIAPVALFGAALAGAAGAAVGVLHRSNLSRLADGGGAT